jgi:hypothetical protein
LGECVRCGDAARLYLLSLQGVAVALAAVAVAAAAAAAAD